MCIAGRGQACRWGGDCGKGAVRVQEDTGRELRMWTVDRLLRTGKMAPWVKAIVLCELYD